jgi:formylglycine-generating enzyme
MGSVFGCNYYPLASQYCTKPAPVGLAALGPGLWGQLDLAGNVTEWNLDFYGYNYVDPCMDCANQTDSLVLGARTVRGGALDLIVSNLLPSARNGQLAPDRAFDLGFRCARTP